MSREYTVEQVEAAADRIKRTCERNPQLVEPPMVQAMLRAYAATLRQAARVDEALHQIKQWSAAYPLSVFPEPDWKRAAEVLEAAGMTLDRISAANMRHVIERVQQIAEAAMAQEGAG